jgi:hypothetical protein
MKTVRSMFQTGFRQEAALGFRPAGGRFRMGAIERQLTEDERNEFLLNFKTAFARAKQADEFYARETRIDSSLRLQLGDYAPRFLDVYGAAGSVADRINPVYERLLDSESGSWVLTENDEGYVNDFFAYMDILSQILATPTPARVRTTFPTPGQIQPAAKTPAGPILPNGAPGGVSTGTLILGGGAALAAGIVLYSLLA